MEKCKKHAQVLAVRQGQSLKKNGGNLVGHVTNKKTYKLYMPSQLPCKQQHFHITNGKLVYMYCFHGESSFFSDKINPKKVSQAFIFLQYTRNFGVKTHFFHKSFFTNECTCISKSLSAGGGSLVF